jgi:hypothetical protein
MKITKEERAELSKYVHKYIYNIYTGGGIFHCERFPIVYLNPYYVYFKRAERKSLDSCTFSSIEKSYSVSDLKFVSKTSTYFNRYYLDVSDFLVEEANEFIQKHDTNRKIEQAEIELRLSEERYLEKKKNYERLLSNKNEVENK